MHLPEYITQAEVQRVCRELGISDWSQLRKASVPLEEAAIIQGVVGGEAAQLSVEDFRQGLEVELEHGVAFPDANVTHNHPILTGMIVLAHLKETLDYYVRLDIVEMEADLTKALARGDAATAARKYRLLVAARARLAAREEAALAAS